MSCESRNWVVSWVLVLVLSLGGGIALPLPLSATAQAEAPETVLERVRRTGRLLAGTRTNTLPFANRTESEAASQTSLDQWQGYSIDLVKRIHADLERQLQQTIQLEFVEVAASERMTRLREGKVDLICDATSFTRSRDLEVDFSHGYFQTGTQLLFNTRIDAADQLNLPYAQSAFIVGVMAGTANEAVTERQLPIAQFVEFPNREAGWQALQQGRIDALASDGILLEVLRQSSPHPEDYVIAPEQPYDQEIYACMLPETDAEFKTFVNTSLQAFMEGVLACRPQDRTILETWFGNNAAIQRQVQDLFQRQLGILTSPPCPK